MRVLVQRVLNASCSVSGVVTGKVEKGYLLFVGYTHTDSKETNLKAIKKILNLRIFEDENGKMNLNINQVGGKILSISQFTLYANSKDGNRPSFTDCLNPQVASSLYDHFNEELKKQIEVECGIFQADMKISLVNDGPCTILLEF